MVTIPKKVAERLAKETGHFQKILVAAKDRDVNESDTVTIIIDMLADIFGFDKYTEITSEFAIKGTYCDLAIKLDGAIKFLIEVKAIGLDLNENHLRQAVNYGANKGIQWVILTNSIIWEIHRIIIDKQVKTSLLCKIDMREINARKKEDQGKLFLLCSEGIRKAAIEQFREHVESVNQFVVGAIIQSDSVLRLIKRELKIVSPGVRVTDDEISHIIKYDILKRDVRDSERAVEARRIIQKAAKKQQKKKKQKSSTSTIEGPVDPIDPPIIETFE